MSNEIKLSYNQSKGYENVDVKTISSREVAEMMEKEHSDLLKRLDGTPRIIGIIPTLTKGNFTVSDYFIPSEYRDASGKMNKEYLCTKLGCDFLANKFTGEKGILFTAKYVKRFEQMETHIKQQIQLPSSPMEVMELMFTALKDTNKDVAEVKADLKDHKENSPLYNIECDELQKAVKKKAVHLLGGRDSKAYKDKSLRQQVFGDLQNQIKREFGVSSYKAIKRSQLEVAKEIVGGYKLPHVLEQEVYWTNNQMSLM